MMVIKRPNLCHFELNPTEVRVINCCYFSVSDQNLTHVLIVGLISKCLVFTASHTLNTDATCFFYLSDEEPEERFVLGIYDVTGNASIDELQSNVTITVLKFGFPNGIFGFKSTSTKVVNEPDTGKVETLLFTVQRTKGSKGLVKVRTNAGIFSV